MLLEIHVILVRVTKTTCYLLVITREITLHVTLVSAAPKPIRETHVWRVHFC
jgi:hypothetical protein